jgi:hypothetical protein
MYNTLDPSIQASKVSFQLLDLMQHIIYICIKLHKCSNLKYWVMHRGLPLLARLGLETLTNSSELGFGASVKSPMIFLGSLEISTSDPERI